MTSESILNKIKEVLLENLKDVRLEKATDETDNYELVSPSIYIFWVPHKNCLHEFGYDIPGIVIMNDEAIDDGEFATFKIRLNIQTYDPGLTTTEYLIPNSNGYKDINNLIEKIRIILEKSPSKLGLMIEKPIKWGFYYDKIQPYWAGYMTFDVKTCVLPSPDLTEFL